MAIYSRNLLMAGAVVAAISASASAAQAGCGGSPEMLKHASWTTDTRDGAVLIPVASGTPIVGMWSITMTLSGGGTFDWGYQVWHDDGTEIMNSGSRAPATENFCMGVWAQEGTARYHLNHLALSYDTSGTLNARVNIKEDVMVDPRGMNFSGPFTADIYNAAGTAIMQHLGGTIIGKRVTPN